MKLKRCSAALLMVAFLTGCASNWSSQRAETADAFKAVDMDSCPVTLAEDSDLNTLVTYALYHNPEVRQAYRLWEAKIRHIRQAGTLPDPMFTFGYFIQEVETRVGPQRAKFGLAQTLPWFGTLDLQKDAAAVDAMVAGESFFLIRNRVRMQVRRAYAEWAYLGKNRVIIKNTIALLEELSKLVTARYGATRGGYSQTLRLDIEIEKQRDRLATIDEMEKPVSTVLYNLLRAPDEFRLAPPAEVPQADAFRGPDLQKVIAENNPSLKVIDMLIKKADVQKRLAEKAGMPSLTLGLDYVYTDPSGMANVDDNGKDPVMAMIRLNLPIWRDKYRAAVEEAESSEAAAVLSREVRERVLRVEVEQTLFTVQKHSRTQKLYSDSIIPKLTEVLDVLKSDYIADKASYRDLIDAQRALLEAELTIEDAKLKRFRAVTTLDFITGR